MPNLFDHLTFRARIDPIGLALQSSERKTNFQGLELWAKRVARGLREAGVSPGQTVVLSLRNKDLHWIVTMALFHEATLSCSIEGPPTGVPFPYDWLLTDARDVAPPPGSARLIRINEAWMKAAVADYQRVECIPYASDDTPVRVFLTSGTTGRAKAVALSTGNLLARARAAVALRGTEATLSTLGHTTAADFNASLTALLTGSPVFVAANSREALDLVRERSIPCLQGSPTQLAGFVMQVADSRLPLTCIKKVRTAGGSLPTRVLKAVHLHLTRNVLTMYASTEAGGTCVFRPGENTDPSVAGYVQGDVTLQVVDDAGRPVKDGEVGQVRIRSPRMVQGYYLNDEETAISFRDGWFHPGDRGSFDEDGLLRLAGRAGEMINSGGVKIDPVVVDRMLAEYAGVQDGAACAVQDPAGLERLAVAVVVGEGFDLRALQDALRDKLPAAWTVAAVLRVPEIPRNEMGKVMRARLREIAQVNLGRRGPPP